MTLLCLSLFDHSGVWSQPWEATHRVVRYDIQTDPTLDVLLLAQNPMRHGVADVILAAPPCTHFTKASSRFWRQYEADGRYQASVDLLRATISIAEAHRAAGGARVLAIENPVGRMRYLFRGTSIQEDPVFTFNPWEYAGLADDPSKEAYRKHTCIWGWGLQKPETDPVEATDRRVARQSWISLIPPGPQRANIRSKTPEGFARAFYRAHYGDND